jgi:DNA-directed RNA polymerase subunit RPC12/RpoP
MITFECSSCKKKIKAPDAVAGKRVPCPGCKAKIDVPLPTTSRASKDDLPEDDFRLQPDPLLDAIGMNTTAPPDPIGAVMGGFNPPPELPSNPYQPTAALNQAVPTAPRAIELAFELPDTRKYFALNVIRITLLVLAALVAIGWIFMLIVLVFGMLFAGDSNTRAGLAMGGGLYLATTFFSGAITCCLLVAGSELIKLAMDVQQNTLAAALYAKHK